MARKDQRRGKSASGVWTAERRRQASERAKRLHAEGVLGGGRKVAKTVTTDAQVSVAERLKEIIANPKSEPNEIVRASRELRMIGVHVADPEQDIEDEIVDAIHDAIYPLIGIGLALGGPARDRMRTWLGEDFSDADEAEIVEHVTATLALVTDAPYYLAELPLARMLRADSPPLSVRMEIAAKAAARSVELAHAPEEEAT